MLNSAEPEIADIYPLSPMQQGMLFLALNAPGTGMYVEQVTYTLRGQLDVSAFERAWQHAAARHTTLRTSLLWEDAGEPLQIVEQEVCVPFRHEDLRGLKTTEQETALRAYLRDDRRRGFDLTRAPLFRLALFRIEDGAYRVVFTHHHVILDGWSIAVLLDEVLAAYGAYASGTDPRLPEPRPYRDYIEWIAAKDQGAAEAFWRKRLANFKEPTLIKLPQTTKPVEGNKEELRLTLPDELSGRLSELSRRAQVTLNTIVQGAWALLLSRYTGKSSLLFGATVSGRPHDLPGVES
ncbi:MAG TPA: condensation domain-containing protein, partial [Pyrinomonadaceae bacterium]|nr:condensation domain-containing protein [Pyrinomonadaceae bacterium]